MASGTIAFLLGALLFQQLSALPGMATWWALPPLVILAVLARGRTRSVTLLMVWGAAGFFWTFLFAAARLDAGLAPELEGQDLEITGVIASVPERRERQVRFEFEVATLAVAGVEQPVPGRVRLNWYGGSPPLVVGEEWRFTVRLRQPRGMVNPGAFDHEGYLFRQGIRATGYVRAPATAQRLGVTGKFPVDRLRQRLETRLDELLADGEFAGIVKALALGRRTDVSDTQWQVLRETGTAHLMAISGLHVGLVAGLLFFLGRGGWALAGLGRWLPAPKAAALLALAGAAGYAALAGFALPTQRALIMSAVALSAILLQRNTSPLPVLALALLAVLLVDPFSVTSPGLWLSFGAVAAIVWAVGARVGRRPRLPLLKVQLAVSIALLPLTIAFFGYAPAATVPANLLAVPAVSLVVVPLTLLGTLLALPAPEAAQWVLGWAQTALGWLWYILLLLVEGLPAIQLARAAPWALAAALLGAVWLIAPRGVPGRPLGLLWLLPLLTWSTPSIEHGAARVTVLDVGQGLATVVETRTRVLVFDTGPRYPGGFEVANVTLLPYLRSRGIAQIDRLVISHGDNDHAGGLAAVRRQLAVGDLLTGSPERTDGDWCGGERRWQWDGVEFRILHPVEGPPARSANNDACVLLVQTAAARALVPSDIEAAAEAALVARLGPEGLAADVLVAPHHGSRTSSSLPFVAAVSPVWVVFSTGYGNRWGFPLPEVTARYQEAGARTLTTAESGAVVFLLPADGGELSVTETRREQRRYWHAR